MRRLLVIAPKNQRKFSKGLARTISNISEELGYQTTFFETERKGWPQIPQLITAYTRTHYVIFISLLQSDILLTALSALPPKPTIWLAFGGDIYTKKYNYFVLKHLVEKINTVFISSQIEGQFTSQKFGIKETIPVLFPIYNNDGRPLLNDLKKILNNEERNSGQAKVLIGNNGYPSQRHEEVLNKLKSHPAIYHLEVLCPYGNPVYIAALEKQFEAYKNIHFHYNFMESKKYIEYLNTFDVAIFNNDRQQGIQTIIILLALGKTLYISEENWAIYFLSAHGFHFFTINKQFPKSLLRIITKSQRDQNRKKCKQFLHDEYFHKELKGTASNIFGNK